MSAGDLVSGEIKPDVIADLVKALQVARVIVADRAAGGRMVTTRDDAHNAYKKILAALAKAGA